MLKIISWLCLAATLHCMDSINSDQDLYNQECAAKLTQVYETMNKNVEFCPKIYTESKYWKLHGIINHTFFEKVKGVPLSEALADLIKQESKSTFECGNAHCIAFWSTLPQGKVDKYIALREEINKDFSFILIMSNTVEFLERYANYYGFATNPRPFMVGDLDINMKDEWKKIQSARKSVTYLGKLFNDHIEPYKVEFYPPMTPLGGSLYLPNVEGII